MQKQLPSAQAQPSFFILRWALFLVRFLARTTNEQTQAGSEIKKEF